MTLPPGIPFLGQAIVHFSVPSALASVALQVVRDRLEVPLPKWLLITLAILARPIYGALHRSWMGYKNQRDAAKLGAILVPAVYDPLPLGLTLAKKFVRGLQTGYPGQIFDEWRQEYGNVYSINLMAENRVITFEPDHIKAILATQFDNFIKGPILFTQFHSLLGTGVFNSDGEMWKFHRSMTRPFFTRERVTDFEVFARNADTAISHIHSRLSEGYPIDFQDLAARFTLDSATEFLFGAGVHSLAIPLDYPEGSPPALAAASARAQPDYVVPSSVRFVEAFTRGEKQTALRTWRGPNWPLYEFWKDKVAVERKAVDLFVEPILGKAIERANVDKGGQTKEEVEKEEASETLLDHLLKHTQDKKILMDELINLLLAGRDTTACTLTFALYMLSEHPDVAARLRAEIIDKVGIDGLPDPECLRSMKYLRAFINEVLRMYPSVPIDSRLSVEPTVLTSKNPNSPPVYIPGGTKCAYSVIVMQRLPEFWGPDAETFDPDRFLDDRVSKYLTPNPFIFVPFNAGPRICLGQQFAYHEVSYFLVRLLQKYAHFQLSPQTSWPAEAVPPPEWKREKEGRVQGREKIRPAAHLTMYVKGGLWMTMTEPAKTDDDQDTR